MKRSASPKRFAWSPELALLRRQADENPYPIYEELRSQGSVQRSALGYWLVLGYLDCRNLLSDDRLGAVAELALRPDVAFGDFPTLEALNRSWVLFADEPRHGILRQRMARDVGGRMHAVTHRSLRPLVERLVRALREGDAIDFVSSVAVPLPAGVLGNILGLAEGDLPWIIDRTAQLSEIIEPFLGRNRLERAERAAQELITYFGGGLDPDTEGSTGGDFTGAPEVGEAVANTAFLATSGHETTTNLLSMGLLALAQDDAPVVQLMRNPELLPQAVEELLRFTSPIQILARVVREPFSYAPYDFAAGDMVLFLVGAANRDPNVFAEPNRLVLTRQRHQHLAFGIGDHTCFGASLARSEARAVLSAVLPFLSELRVDEASLRWKPKRTVRGLQTMHVARA